MSITEIPKLLVYGRLKVQWKQFQKYGIPSIDRKLGTLLAPLLKANSMAVFDAAEKYMNDGQDLIILAGNEYGSGSSRDWAAKGPQL